MTLCLLCATAAQAVDYSIVAVRAPRRGDNQATAWQDVMRPWAGEPGSDLVIIRPDGSEVELVDAGNDGMVLDPSPSLDGKWVYYAFVANQRLLAQSGGTYSGADIYKVNVDTRQIVRLTHQEWTPALGVARWARDPIGRDPQPAVGESFLGYGIYNTGPCEVPGGRLIFTSSRNGYAVPKGYTFPNQQLYSMDTDGKNVEQIGYLNVSSSLHPTLLKSGEIVWSSSESQGMRNAIIWGLWSSRPDGSEWNPVMSAFALFHSIHFQTQQPDGKIATTIYYINNNKGFGTIYRFPHKPEPPTDLHAFHSPILSKNPQFKLLYGNGFVQHSLQGYTPWGTEIVTSFANPYDQPAGPANKPGNERFGKVTHPAAGPDGLFMVYSPGPVNFATPPYWPAPHGQIAFLPYDKSAVEHPSALTVIREDPNFNYQQPRPLLSFKQIYGHEPVELPWNPNDGTVHTKLPAGTPLAIVGTSSVYNRNSTGNGEPGDFGTLTYQGGDVGVYKNSDIHAIRIVQQLPQSHRGLTRTAAGNAPHTATVGWRQMGPPNLAPNERMKIMGEVLLRKFDAEGNPILDAKGDPDTSFQARIPADVPFTFQLVDSKGKTLVHSQTWHQLRPGERRVNCGGCHAHAQSPVDFDLTVASKPNYVIADLLDKPREVEWNRDVKAIVETECKGCHTTNAAAKARMDLTNTLDGFVAKTLLLQSRISPTILAADGNLPHAAIAPQKVRTLSEWIDLGMLVDDGQGKAFDDNINPTLTLASPTRDEAATTIIVGAFDNESGLVKASLTATLNGAPVSLLETTQHIWTATLPQPVESGRLSVSVQDKQGNIARIDRTFNGNVLPEPPVDPDEDLEEQIAALEAQLENVREKAAATTAAARATESAAAEAPAAPVGPVGPAAEYLGRDADKLGDLRSKVPDGKPDHHIRLTGLRHPIQHINIHDGAVKWSDMAGEESPEFPQGKWWWVMTTPPLPGSPNGVNDIYISDRGTPGNFVVFPIYADGSFDRLEVPAR